MSEIATEPSPYAALQDRAFAFLNSQGGRASEDDLIRFLFGASTKPALWTSLLRTVMSGDHRFRQTFGGTWSLADEPIGAGGGLAEFVALDVETTGLKPYQHRIIEIGLARYQNNRCVDRYSALVNPERRLPEYIVKLTGLTDSDLIPAPKFGQIAHEVVTFIGSSPILGHNIGFDIGFLNAELERTHLRIVENPAIDTIPLAMTVLGRRVRPSLDRVSAAVGLGRTGRHRALADAELTAEVALRLWAMAIQGGADPRELYAIGTPRRGETRPHGGNASMLLDRALMAELPSRPGVYLMVDAEDRILYVGKAKSIRDRVGSYYSQPLGYTRKMDGLVEQIRRIDHEETGSELLALLLEAQLIRRHQPPYNRMLRNSESYPFIRIDPANNWPTLRLARQPRPDGARYFGPYRSRSTAREAIDLLNRRFRLRSCNRGFRTPGSYGNPCLELDLKRCDGPCVGRADADRYRSGVREVLAFLEGDGAILLDDVDQEIARAVDALRYEEAQRLRVQREILGRLVAEQRALNEMRVAAPCLIIQPAPGDDLFQAMLIVEGQWWSSVRFGSCDSVSEVASRLEQSWERYCSTGTRAIDHANVDDAAIIARWRKLAASEQYTIVLDSPLPDWVTAVEQGCAIAAGWQEHAVTGKSIEIPVVVDYNTGEILG
jgi:DNA polymerase III epsilon subunit family exonuclease